MERITKKMNNRGFRPTPADNLVHEHPKLQDMNVKLLAETHEEKIGNIINYLALYPLQPELLIGNFIYLFIIKRIVYEKNHLTRWSFLCRFDRIACMRSIYQQQELESFFCRSY
jgi:hypothetical protein